MRSIHHKLGILVSISAIFLCQSPQAAEPVSIAGSDYKFKVPEKTEKLLERYCYDCHDDGLKKGGIRLDHLEELGQQARLNLLNQALEHTFSGEMPPKKEDQPTVEERDALAEWMWEELKIFNASKLEDKLNYYKYANYLSHDKLFSGDNKDAPYTKSRRWRVNELIYHERINDVFELEGKKRLDSFFGVVKPFNLPNDPGVAYYDNEIVEGGQFLTLLSNAKWIVDKQLRAALEKSGDYQHTADWLEAKKKGGRNMYMKFPDEIWNPDQTAAPLEAVVKTNGKPSNEILAAAITHQYKVALQREPSSQEMEKYLGFFRMTIEESDTNSALKKMMVSVLMEPEFLYRNEFGGGEPDANQRKKLTSREASYAIAYALTDRIPDRKLVEAAESVKLQTREDYEREVRRILGDSSIAKPRILRFFQDYFGYKGIFDVFKDEERFGGHYNPTRVVSTRYIYRVPGKVSQEADTLVEWVLQKDKDVLATLLTTDRFFVHHNGDNKEMIKRSEQATKDFNETYREMYKRTLGMKPMEAAAEVAKMHEEKPALNLQSRFLSKDGKVRGILMSTLKEASVFLGKDGTRDHNTGKVFMPHDGEAIPHSVKMYNLDHFTWSYEAVQPMKIDNRAGMLTHPAWLVANSQNAAADPIHRGKWVREKLLGGFIRDVPITVDAKVPEDPHSTLRERFAVTEEKKCWMCHEKMNPLGYVFESYDDFGQFRTEEKLEYPENIIKEEKYLRLQHGPYVEFKMPIYKTKPVNSTGFLEGTGDSNLDGPVKDVNDLVHRLAKSERVRQVFVRNVFRYFMGRNETLSDSPSLIQADKVYVESGGSFRELMVSILTSDSFIYRK
jgi:hypothetical protein